MNELIIEKVREHEVLYNSTLLDYRDLKIRQETWEKIGRELNIKAEKAKEMWDKLRRCYCNAMNRRRERKSGFIKQPWKYEQQMSFIFPYLDSRKAQAIINDPNFSTDPSFYEVDFPEDEAEKYFDRLLKEEEQNQENERKRKKNPVKNQGIKRKKYIPINNTNKKKTVFPVQQILDIMKKQSTQNILETMDDTDLFFLSMSRMAKRLPMVEQCNIKLTLSNAVLQAEMRNNHS